MNKLKITIACSFLLGLSPIWAKAEQKLSFMAAVDAIMERSTDLSISQSQLRAVEYVNIGTRTAFFPSLSYAYQEGTTKTDGVSGRANSARSGFDASWNLFSFGADASSWKAAIREERKFESQVDATTLTVQASAVTAITNFIGQEAQVAVARKLYDLNLDSHKIAKARFQKGLLPKQEVDKVFIDVQNAKARWQDARIRFEEANADLIELLGHNRLKNDWPWISLLTKDTSILPKLEAGFLLENVPSWKAADFDFDSKEHLVSSAFRDFLPSVDATGSYNFGGTNTTTTEYTGAITLTIPLFDRLSRYSTYKAQVESRAQSELSREATRRSVESEWTAARSAFAIALDTAKARASALEIARRIYRDNERRFRGGRITANDLSLDQERLFRAEQNAVNGWTTLHLAVTRLCHAKGQKLRTCLPSLGK